MFSETEKDHPMFGPIWVNASVKNHSERGVLGLRCESDRFGATVIVC
jgi:hypothetical protein